MANINAKQVNNIRAEKITTKGDYGTSYDTYTVNGTEFTEEDLYELTKDILDILPYNYAKYRENPDD